jgi:hypothetical protein
VSERIKKITWKLGGRWETTGPSFDFISLISPGIEAAIEASHSHLIG